MVVAKNTECKVVGTVPADQAGELEELLMGMAGRAGQEFRVLEVGMKTAGRPVSQLLLTRPLGGKDTPGSSQSWVARTEPPLIRGATRDLAVGVRLVTEAPIRGISVPVFWEALGLSHSHQCVKAGRKYDIDVQQQSVQVSVCQLQKVAEKGDLKSASDISPQHRLVEVVCRVADGEFGLGADVIGKLGEQLKPLVHLQRC